MEEGTASVVSFFLFMHRCCFSLRLRTHTLTLCVWQRLTYR
nr:MAG TPA: hypothetical protein [Caudoviricetes sp.]